MKTPKKTIPCPQCGAPCELGISVIESWDERYEVPALFCTRSGEEVVGNAKAICARWKRKNREARLRRKIVYMEAQIRRAEMAIPGLLRYIERLKRGGDGHTLGLVLSGELASLGVAQMFLDMMKSIRRKGADQ